MTIDARLFARIVDCYRTHILGIKRVNEEKSGVIDPVLPGCRSVRDEGDIQFVTSLAVPRALDVFRLYRITSGR